MPSILDKIFAAKRDELSERRARVSLNEIIEASHHAPPPRDFIGALRSKSPAIIAEIKRASPSKGDILPGLDPASVARGYAAAGAAAISVLTDRHFKGSLDDLRAARAAVDLPLLRKDFIFDEYQLYEARAAGADCILVIAAMLRQDHLAVLIHRAKELSLATLVEVHDQAEFSLVQSLDAELIGINNRDLHTFKTDIATTEQLLKDYSGNALIVSESGIESAVDIARLSNAGARAFLIGESLLKAGHPQESLAILTRPSEHSADVAP
jgi:indole-3-glycerol phosphate synthase